MSLEYLQDAADRINLPLLQNLLLERSKNLLKEGTLKYHDILEADFYQKAGHLNFKDAWIEIGKQEELSADQYARIKAAAQELIPWRKGPFSLFDIQIDAEWQSQMKWDRIKEGFTDLKDKIICDVGCNNGYYMFRMALQKPWLVLGMDPFVPYYSQFHFLNKFAQCTNLQHELLGSEELVHFDGFFDLILSMGLIYHYKDPLLHLREIKTALKPGGKVLMESMGIRGEGSYALFPEDRYAQMRNVWFLPTKDCLYSWLKRAGFKHIELLSESETELEEQRNTTWCPEERFQSLKYHLDPQNPKLTIEGHPGPARFAFLATKA